MGSLNMASPAKINLRLKVLGKRPDGYHDLSMMMTRLGLQDEIYLEENRQGIELMTDAQELPTDDRNIAYRTAELFFKETGVQKGLKVTIKKKIPIAAGLGGGSSNAASVLKGLEKLFEKRLPEEKRLGLAKSLGADVPFFMMEGPQLAEGIGERLFPLEIKCNLPLILINPGFVISTQKVYQTLNLPLGLRPPLTPSGSHASLPRSFKDLKDLLPFLENDLEAVVLKQYPEVAEIKKELLEDGAAAVLMSGSGPTVFGVYENQGIRDRGVERLTSKAPKAWKIFSTETVF